MKSAPIRDLDWRSIFVFKVSLKDWMETTAAIPKTIDPMNNASFLKLALASLQAILKSQELLVLTDPFTVIKHFVRP